MSNKKIIWGILLIALGVLFILKNFGIIFFSWRLFLSLWPLIIVIIGITLLPLKEWLKLLISILLIVVVFAIVILTGKSDESCWHWHKKIKMDEKQTIQSMSLNYNSNIKQAKLNLDAVAGKFILDSISPDLISFNKTGTFGEFSLTGSDQDSTSTIHLKMKDNHFKIGDGSNRAIIKLNPNPVWKIEINAGAAEIYANLENQKVAEMDFEGGASKMTVRIGKLLPVTTVKMESGVTSITIEIPSESGCELQNKGALTKKDFEGFEKKGDGIYRTENFSNSPQKIFIISESAVSELNIIKY